MPTYRFKSTEWDDSVVVEDFMTISEMEQFMADNPHVYQELSTPAFAHSERIGRKKPDDGFRDVLRNIKKKHIHSTVNTF